MKKKIAVLLAGAMLMMASSAMATLWPTAAGGWSNTGAGSNIENFLNLSYFNGYTEVAPPLNFNGVFAYTAIAHESGNINVVEQPAEGALPSAGFSGTDVTFNTSSYANWGALNYVDFNKTNLYFEDSNGPFNVNLSPYSGTSTPGFKIFQLTANSNALTYLAGDPTLILNKGTYIVGFNDNSLVDTDSDFDDIIIAIAPVPEPGTMMLLGFGMLGLAVYGKRRMSKNA